MPRVLRVLNRLVTGGPVWNALLLSRHLPAGFDTRLLVGAAEAHEESAAALARELQVPFRLLPAMGRSLHPLQDLGAFRALRTEIRRFRPHIVHTHGAKPGVLARMAALAEAVPVIVHTYHGHVFHSYFGRGKSALVRSVERYLARRTDALVVLSPQQQWEICQRYRIAPPERCRLIPLGLDLGRFESGAGAKRQQFRAAFRLDPDTLAIGIIGRLVPVKDHLLFLEAFARLRSECSRSLKAFIVGDGLLRAELQDAARRLGLSVAGPGEAREDASLVFTSWRSDMDVVLAGLDIVCLSSRNEGTPVSLIEAQAAGRPVVATRAGGVADTVAEGKTALLCDPGDRAGFCGALQRLVDDEELRRSLGAAGPAWASERFGYRRMVQDVAQLYTSLLDARGCGTQEPFT